MKKAVSIILMVVMVLLASISTFASEETITLTEFLGVAKEDVTVIRLFTPNITNGKTISDSYMIEKFFAVCDSTYLMKQENNESASRQGLFIEVATNESKKTGYAYISEDGDVDKYTLAMSRLPAKMYSFENTESVQAVISDILSLTEIDSSKFSDWAKEYVLGAEKLGICSFDDYTEPVTRLEFCEMIYKAISMSPVPLPTLAEQETRFNDCNSTAVHYLNGIGVINGTGENTFSPDDKIYREEVAAIVYRMAKYLDLKGFYDDYRLSSYMFIDQDKMSAWAVEAISQLKTVGLMDGVGEDMFAPKAVFTREQATVLTMKLFSKILADHKPPKPKQTELRIRIQEDMVTDEVKDAVKLKYSDKAILEMMPEDKYLEITNLIIAAGEPCVIIGKYNEEFLKRLDEWGIEHGEFINGLTYIHNNIEIGEVIETTVSKDLQGFFEKESILLTCEMDSLAESEEYISLMTASGDIKSEIEKIADGDYVNPKEVHFIALDDETILKIITNYSSDKTIAANIYEKIKNRFNGSIVGNMINARYGSNVLATTAMLTYGKGYMMPKDFNDNTTVVLKYDGDYSSIVSFSKTGDGVIGANAMFVKNTNQDIMELIEEIIGKKV